MKENPLLLSDTSGYEGENEDTHNELLLTKRFSPSMMKHVREMLKKHEQENTIQSLSDEYEYQEVSESQKLSDYEHEEEFSENQKLSDYEHEEEFNESQKLSEDFKTPILTQFSTPLISLTPVDLRADLSSYHSDILKSVLQSENEGLRCPIPAIESLDFENEPLYLAAEPAAQESYNITQEASSNQICLTPPFNFYSQDTPQETEENPQIAFSPAESFHEDYESCQIHSPSSQHYNSSNSTSQAQFPSNCILAILPSISFTPSQPIEEAKFSHSHQQKYEENSVYSSKSSNYDCFLVPAASTYQSSSLLIDENHDSTSSVPKENQILASSTLKIAEPSYESGMETDKDKSSCESFYKIEEEVHPNRSKKVRAEIATEIHAPIAVEISEICISQEDKLKVTAEMIGMNWDEDWRYRYLVQDFIEATQDYDVDEEYPVLEQYRNYFHDLKHTHENLYIKSKKLLSEQPRYLILTQKYQDAISTYFEHSYRSVKLTKKSLTNQIKSNSVELQPMRNSVYSRYERHVNSALDQIIQSLLSSLNPKLPISTKIKRLLETISEQSESSSSSDPEEDKQNLSLGSTPRPAHSQKLVIDISPHSPSIYDEKFSPQEFYSPVSSLSEKVIYTI